MKKKVAIPVIVVAFVALLVLAAPAFSASTWKSSMLTTANSTTEAINKTATATEAYNSTDTATAADFDNLIASYDSQLISLQAAHKKAQSVGGFSLIDVTGTYKEAKDISAELSSAYADLIAQTEAQIASAETEKAAVLAIEQSSSASDASAISQSAVGMRTAAASYQKFINGGQASEFEVKFAALLPRFAELLDQTAAALNSNSLAQLTAVEQQLNSILAEFEALEAQRAVLTAPVEQKQQALIDKLNETTKKLQ